MRLTTLILGVPALALFAFAQTDRSTNTQSNTTTTTTEKTETKTKTDNTMSTKGYKGMLVDANCAGGSGTSSRTTDTSGNTGSATNTSTNSGNSSSTADRSTGESGKESGSASKWQSCPVTASTTTFGLVTSDGRMLRFDDVGNTRAQEAVKSHSKWAGSSKPPKVKVHGIMTGDTLQVQEIR